MAIRLHVQENNVKLKVGQGLSFRLKASEGVPVYPETYTGTTEITPSQEVQTIPTEGYYMASSIRVNPIPSNYGLITYNGSIITVS